MAKQPYIPLYIGDWEQDTNCLSPLAEFALLKLVFKLFKSEKRGVFIANFRTLSILFKSDIDKTKDIFQELIDNNILNISPICDDKFEIISRRMIREANISEIRANVGKSGGRGNKKQTKSKSKAKRLQNADIDNDIDNDIITNKLLNINGDFQKIFDRWLSYKKARKENYKTEDSKNTALKKLIKFSDNNLALAAEIIDDAIGNNYAGFFEPKNKNHTHSAPMVY